MPENKNPGRPGGQRRTGPSKPRTNADGQQQSPRNRSNQPPRRGPNQGSSTNRPRTNQRPAQAAPQRPMIAEEPREDDVITSGPEQPEYVTIAQISAPFGLRGAVKASVRTDFPNRFETL